MGPALLFPEAIFTSAVLTPTNGLQLPAAHSAPGREGTLEEENDYGGIFCLLREEGRHGLPLC